MKTKALVAALFAAGFAASFALADGGAPAGSTSGSTSSSTSTSTTTTGEHGKGKGDDNGKKADKPKCQKVELNGSKGSGSVTFTVDKANKHGDALEGKSVTLTIPADAKIKANACMDAAGALTLHELKVSAKGGDQQH